MLLGEFDTPWTFLRVGFHGGQLGADKVGDAVLYAGECTDLSALGTVPAVAAGISVALRCPGIWSAYGITIGETPDAPLPRSEKTLHWDATTGMRVR